MVGGIALGYMGITKIANNSAAIEILDLEIDASNESGEETGASLLEGCGTFVCRWCLLVKKK